MRRILEIDELAHYPSIDTELLRSFVAIADTGGFTRAAETVNRTQSAISMQMKRLEDDVVQRALFERDGRQVRLTPEFGSEAMAADLSNLLPGAWLDIGYADTCAFQLPFAEVRYEYRAVVVDAVPMEGSALTPVTSDAIMMGRLEQLDVELTDEGEEVVMAALMPTAEWDGTTPTGWRDPAAGED